MRNAGEIQIETREQAEEAARALAEWGCDHARARNDFEHYDVLEEVMCGAVLAQVEDPDYSLASDVAEERMREAGNACPRCGGRRLTCKTINCQNPECACPRCVWDADAHEDGCDSFTTEDNDDCTCAP